jgi:hypothetical protein
MASNTQTTTAANVDNERNDIDIAGAIIAFFLSPVVMMIALALALLAQGKHTADVFTYYSHDNTPWWLSYAFAAGVEVAVFLFVLHGHKGKSYMFAFAAFATNVVYYAIGGAALLTAELVPVLLLSALLPGVIVGYSHTIAEKPMQVGTQAQRSPARSWWHRVQFWRKPAGTPVLNPTSNTATPAPVATPGESGWRGEGVDVVEPPRTKPAKTHKQPAPHTPGRTNEYGMTDTALADLLNVQRQAVGAMRNRGTLAARVARDLPELAPVHTNGFNAQ